MHIAPPQQMRIYLDTCCFNRPFDQMEQDRVAVEAEAVLRILARVESNDWLLCSSDAVLFEIGKIPYLIQREACLAMARLSQVQLRLTADVATQAKRFAEMGFGVYDAAHLAFALHGQVELFFTVDDRLLRKAAGCKILLPFAVVNPAVWLATQNQGGTP